VVAVLAVVLALSAAENAFATVELAYDTGSFGHVVVGTPYAGVGFSLPSGVSSARLRYVRWADQHDSLALTIHITGPGPDYTELSGSPIALGSDPAGTGCPAGWVVCYGLDLTSFGIVVTGDFFVILERTADSSVYEDDASSGSGRSFVGYSLSTWTALLDRNLLIRVDIDPIVPRAGGPVGGLVEPVNKLAVFVPYLALFGVLAVIVIAAVPWKKRGNQQSPVFWKA